MRLFVAINFEKDIRDKLEKLILELKRYSLKGTFVRKDLLHLTLEFLGDISGYEVSEIKKVMEEISDKPFLIRTDNIGCFNRRNGHIYWVGIEDNEGLLNLQSNLHKKLDRQGFKLSQRPYKPHITLGRRIRLREDFFLDQLNSDIRGLEIPVNKIDLVKSAHIEGRLTYRTIYSKKLGESNLLG